MEIKLQVERRVTAIVEQYLEFTVSQSVWDAALIEHDGDREEALDALNYRGSVILDNTDTIVGEVLMVHETIIEESEN